MAEYDLKKSIAKIGEKRLNAALYKGTKENQVLITPRPANAKQVADLEKTCGEAKRIFKGVCFWEANKLIFATKANPSSAWETMITRVMKDHHCGEYLPIELRKLAEHESDEAMEDEAGEGEDGSDGGVPPSDATIPPPPPPPTEAAAAFSARLKGLLPDLAKAIATGKPSGLEAKQRAADAGNAARAEDFPQANSLLDEAAKLVASTLGVEPTDRAALKAEYLSLKGTLSPRITAAVGTNPPNKAAILEKLKAAIDKEKAADFPGGIEALKQLAAMLPGASTTIPTPPPAPPPPPPPTPAPDMAAQLNQAVQKITPAVQQAVAAHPERKGEIIQMLSALKQFMQAGKYPDAKQALTALVSFLGTLGHAGTGTAPSAPQTKEEEAPEHETEGAEVQGDEAEWHKAFALIEPRYLAALRAQPDEATRLRAMMMSASDLGGDGKFPEALAALLKLEERLDALGDSETEETGGGYAGIVAYRKTLLNYAAAFQQVSAQIDALKAAVPAELPGELELANALADELHALNDDVRDTVDEAMNAAENVASPVTKKLAATLTDYVTDVNSNPLVRHADNNPFGVTMTIATTLGNALAAIRAAMPAAV